MCVNSQVISDWRVVGNDRGIERDTDGVASGNVLSVGTNIRRSYFIY